jgi:hypothetical protein
LSVCFGTPYTLSENLKLSHQHHPLIRQYVAVSGRQVRLKMSGSRIGVLELFGQFLKLARKHPITSQKEKPAAL